MLTHQCSLCGKGHTSHYFTRWTGSCSKLSVFNMDCIVRVCVCVCLLVACLLACFLLGATTYCKTSNEHIHIFHKLIYFTYKQQHTHAQSHTQVQIQYTWPTYQEGKAPVGLPRLCLPYGGHRMHEQGIPSHVVALCL